MKRFLLALLCALILLPLTSCGSANHIWKDASPGTSMLSFYSYADNSGHSYRLSDQGKAGKVLAALSAVDAVPVTNWSAEQITFPVYGIEIGSTDGVGILAAWSNGYLILRDRSVYRFAFDFAALKDAYDWEYRSSIDSLSGMPCGRLLSEGSGGWIAEHLAPAGELTPPEDISMTLKEDQPAGKIAVILINRGEKNWTYGEGCSIHVLLDDVWYKVPVTDDKNWSTIGIGYGLPSGEAREKTYSLYAYGDLPAGTYRLVIEGLSAEFTLN